MNKKKEFGKKQFEQIMVYIKPTDAKTACVSMVFSLFTVFAFLIVAGPLWYQAMPQYSELITGLTTFSGYPKEADMRLVKIMLGSSLLFMAMNAWIRICTNVLAIGKEALFAFGAGYAALLVLVINGSGQRLSFGITLAVLFAAYVILRHRNEISDEHLKEFGLNSLLFYLAAESISIAVCSLLHVQMSAIAWKFSTAAILIVILGYAFLYRRKQFDLKRHMAFWQLFLPFSLLGFVYFRYEYETTGEVFTLFYSPVYKYFLYLMVILLLAWAGYRFLKKKNGILLSTVMITACMRVFVKPDGILSLDFFHMGEMSTPWRQFVSYGKIPFFDLMPIHGLCDYYYSLINQVFFDGSYLALNAAMCVGNLFLSAFLATVMFWVTKDKGQVIFFVYCFMPFMINGAGIRYIFLFVMFFVLFSKEVRADKLRYIWWYVFLAIVSIAWNVSIGGAGAAAFFLVVLMRMLKVPGAVYGLMKEGDRKEKGRFFTSYLFLFLMGISFIPVFLRIVVYLKENAGTTLMANGMAMIEELSEYKDYLVPGLFQTGEVSFLHIFGFVIPFAVCLFLAFYGQNRRLQKSSREFAVILFVCFYIIANYAFVRFDKGLRSGVISVFFMIVVSYTLLKEWCIEEKTAGLKRGYLILLLLTVMLSENPLSIDAEKITANKEVKSYGETTIMGQTVEDPIVYVTGDSVGMKYLGNGFVRGNTLQNLQNIKYVLETELLENKEYLDMTNAVANYVFMDMSMVLPYTSGYNISNEKMQETAVELLKEKKPELILLAPYIRFDEATISLRSPKLYEYFLEEGYEPYVYENVIYMRRGKSRLFEKSNGEEAFAQLMHKEALQMLPAVWGNSEAVSKLKTVMTANESALESETQLEDDRIVYRFKQKVSGNEIDFIEITLPESTEQKDDVQFGDATKEAEKTTMYLQFGEGEKEQGFSFELKGKRLLIPVFSSPYWKEQKELKSFSLTVKEGDKEALKKVLAGSVQFYRY